MPLILYHNPKCSKSRETLALLLSRGVKPEVVEYLKNPPSPEDLEKILTALKLEPQGVMRTKEKTYEDLGLANKKLTRAEGIRIIAENPVLLERPILVNGEKAAIGRPPENVLAIL